MANLTREQMLEMGMSEEQISMVLGEVPKKSEAVIPMPVAAPQQQIPVGFGTTVPINCTEAMQTTSIFDLQTYAKGTLVRFPDFAEGQPFVA